MRKGKILKKTDKETDTDTGTQSGGSTGSRNPFNRNAATNDIGYPVSQEKNKKTDKDTDTDTGSSGGGTGGRSPFKRKRDSTTIDITYPGKRGRGDTSILIAETKAMERSRRLLEQQGERRLASVKAREHSNEEHQQQSPEGELQNSILQHPALDSQRFDGIDPNLNPEPPLNTEARREYDNERRNQEQEKQLRLGNTPTFRNTPTPHGP